MKSISEGGDVLDNCAKSSWVKRLSLIVIFLFFAGYAQKNHTSDLVDQNRKLEARLTDLFDRTIKNDESITGAILLVDAPDRGFFRESARGGGIATTAHDLRLFLRAFVNNAIFNDAVTIKDMLNWIYTGIPGVYYGLGMERVMLDEAGLSASGEMWGHSGFPNSFMFYGPRQNVIIVGTLNQAVPRMTDAHLIASEIMAILEDAQ